jgi:putative transposase
VTQAEALLDGKRPKAVIADKGFDSDAFIKAVVEAGAEAVIPPRANRKTKRSYDKDLYKERNRVERVFSKLKHYRRIATRYDKSLANFIGAIKLAAIHIWLR